MDTRLRTRVLLRLMAPLLFVLLVASLHRSNVGMAAISMNAEIGLSPVEYGLGASILFCGFVVGKYPSVALAHHAGFRWWMFGCLLLSGLCSLTMASIQTDWQFISVRFVLGLAEAGLAPGIMIYASQFATDRSRAAAFALPMLAMPLSLIIGGPLAGWLMQQDAFSLTGWRWMFAAEGALTVAVAFVALGYFRAGPEAVDWITEEERRGLRANAILHASQRKPTQWAVLGQPTTWLCMAGWFFLLSGSYGLAFWLPQVAQSLTGLDPFALGLISAIPWVGSLVGILSGALLSDRTGMRWAFVIGPCLVAAAAMVMTVAPVAGIAALYFLFLAGLGRGVAQGAFWAVPSLVLQKSGLATAIVGINICGNLAGAVFPNVIARLSSAPSDPSGPALAIAVALALAAGCITALRLMAAMRPSLA